MHMSGTLQHITPEMVLGRAPVGLVNENILSFVQGKTVLVTGAAGSIGSELCRQIANHAPRRLVTVDINENGTFWLERELLEQHGDKLNLSARIASVRDEKKLARIFSAERPDIVLHAAAHKHVPLMEHAPDEAVKNNIFGTWNAAKAAAENGVKKFVLISTDKAVNPISVMGATKRVCEMLISYFDTISETSFAAVRFGNVLGSNGSVMQLFLRQLERGEDLTVTHPDITRYFMTIAEACQLVLTAGAMANGGEIFVLDMGEPVKIDTLARRIIALSGANVGVRYVGLRKGDKLYEELLLGDDVCRTQNRKVFVERPSVPDYDTLQALLSELRTLVSDPSCTDDAVCGLLCRLVPTFRH